jgi:hypothetical protein
MMWLLQGQGVTSYVMAILYTANLQT